MKNKSTSKKNPPNELLQTECFESRTHIIEVFNRTNKACGPTFFLVTIQSFIIPCAYQRGDYWGVQLAAVVKHKGSHTSYFSGEWTVERGFPFHIQQSQLQPYRHRDHSMTCFIHKKFAQAKPLALFFILP